MASDYIYDINDILESIPHRYPFLLIDRITAIDGSKSIEGYKNVTINEPYFQGHFPGEPIMPGVLQVEAMAQIGAMLLRTMIDDYKNKLVFFLGFDKVRFRRPVRPGDRLDFKVEIIRPSLRAAKMQGFAFVDGEEVCRATIIATVVDKKNIKE